MAARRLQLQASVETYHFYQLSNLELTWVAEHMPRAGSARCLNGAQSLQRKHEVAAPFPPRIPDLPFLDLRRRSH